MKETTRCVQQLLYFAAAGLGFGDGSASHTLEINSNQETVLRLDFSTAFGKVGDSFIVHTIYGIMV